MVNTWQLEKNVSIFWVRKIIPRISVLKKLSRALCARDFKFIILNTHHDTFVKLFAFWENAWSFFLLANIIKILVLYLPTVRQHSGSKFSGVADTIESMTHKQ